MRTQKDLGERVVLFPDGKYRWIYEVNMLTNYSILFDVWKVFGITMLIVMGLIGFILLIAGEFDLDSLTGLTAGLGLTAAILFVLSFVGYYLYAAIVGGKYIVVMTMDHNEVVHQQLPKQMKKAQIIGNATIVAGLLTGNLGAVGRGMIANSRTSMITRYADVKKVIAVRGNNLIKVNETLEKNRVYVCDEDFDFVYRFLCEHCPSAKHL